MFSLVFKIAPKIHKNFLALQIITLKFFFIFTDLWPFTRSNYHLARL